jgi:putative tryptophan/tyrosine transport system substrate-binding protein
MRRREFIAALGGAAALPVVVRAQQTAMPRIGVLLHLGEDDPEGKARLAGFRQGLERLGWSNGHNVRMDVRWSDGNVETMRTLAKELVDLRPDVIFAPSPPSIEATLRESRAIPIVFAGITDPIGAGWVASLPRPGGNLTGFTLFEPSIVGKWVAMLKEIAPRIGRVGLLLNTGTNTLTSDAATLPAASTMASSLDIELEVIHFATAADIERAVESIAREPNAGLVVPPGDAVIHRDLIIALAARHRLPTVYYARFWVTAGGLMSFGTDYVDQYRQAAAYVSRILRGERPADLPVQAPTKYETVLNLKTAKALNLTVPDLMLVRADEVIE